MSRYDLLLGGAILGVGAALFGCSSDEDDDGGGTLSTLSARVGGDGESDAEAPFQFGRGCEGATLSTPLDPGAGGGSVRVLMCLNRPPRPPRP